jgi:hypothetical protein
MTELILIPSHKSSQISHLSWIDPHTSFSRVEVPLRKKPKRQVKLEKGIKGEKLYPELSVESACILGLHGQP